MSDQNTSEREARKALVPEEERAQASNTRTEEVRIEVFNPRAEDLIPDEERAVGGGAGRITKLRQNGIVSPAKGMGRICGAFGDTVLADIRVDGDGTRWYEFVQQFKDGTSTPKIRIKQADLVRLCTCKFQPEQLGNRIERRKAATCLSRIGDEYLNAIIGEEILVLPEVLSVLFHQSKALPVIYEEEHSNVDELYARIVQILDCEWPSLCCEKKQAYYALFEDGMDELAKTLGKTRLQLLKTLKDHDLLYLQESSVGYQSKVRLSFSDTPADCYCIYDLKFFSRAAGIEDEEPPAPDIL